MLHRGNEVGSGLLPALENLDRINEVENTRGWHVTVSAKRLIDGAWADGSCSLARHVELLFQQFSKM